MNQSISRDSVNQSADLRTRIAAALGGEQYINLLGNGYDMDDLLELADAVIRELGAIPDRVHVDDQGRRWEWCGGVPGTWAWRITRLDGR